MTGNALTMAGFILISCPRGKHDRLQAWLGLHGWNSGARPEERGGSGLLLQVMAKYEMNCFGSLAIPTSRQNGRMYDIHALIHYTDFGRFVQSTKVVPESDASRGRGYNSAHCTSCTDFVFQRPPGPSTHSIHWIGFEWL